MTHVPVLLNEVLEGLAPAAGETFVDATLGGGGHSKAIAERLGSKGHLITLDVDPTAIAYAKENLQVPCRLDIVQGNFSQMHKLVGTVIGSELVDGVLMDLGFRSDQLESGKGLSFQHDEELLMTLGDPKDYPFTAADIVNEWEEENIREILEHYGEEPFAERIAKAIVDRRLQGGIATTGELVRVIDSTVPAWYRNRRINPATKTFQALRMAVNNEVGVLREGLEGAWGLLRAGGRLGVISFHGVEARVVKNFYKERRADGSGEILTKNAIKPSRTEVVENPRSRSAELRIISKK